MSIHGTARVPKQGTSLMRVIDALIEELFSAEKRRLNAELEKIIAANGEAYGSPLDAVIYQGNVHVPLNKRSVIRRVVHITLNPMMQRYVADKATIDKDKQRIRQMLFRVIDPCETLQDLRDALPNCLAPIIPAIAQLDRTKEEGHTVADDPKAKALWDKIMPKIKMYSSTRLLY